MRFIFFYIYIFSQRRTMCVLISQYIFIYTSFYYPTGRNSDKILFCAISVEFYFKISNFHTFSLIFVIINNLPEVKSPTEKRLSFNSKLKWTLIILVSYFILSNIAVYGADPGFLEQFEFLAVIIGTNFGSIISLGIGPIVMASIILQLLVGFQ